MAYLLPKAWSPGYAIPKYIRDEGLQRHAFVTQEAPSGTYDNPALENAAYRSGYVIPRYVLDDGYGGGASITQWAKRGSYFGPKIPDFLAKRANRVLGKKAVANNGTALLVQSLGDVGSGDPLVQYGHDAAGTILAGVRSMPPKARGPALRKILGKIDPSLYGRASKNANALSRQGMAPAAALHNGLAAAMSAGIHKELHEAGTSGRVRRGQGQLGLAGYEALGLAAGGAAAQSGARNTGIGTGSSASVYLAAGVPSQYPLMQVGPFQLPAYAVAKAAAGPACAHEPCPNYDPNITALSTQPDFSDSEKAYLAAMQAAMPYYAGHSGIPWQPADYTGGNDITTPAPVTATAPDGTPYQYLPGYHLANLDDMPSWLSGLNGLPATTPALAWSEFGGDAAGTAALLAQNADPNYWATQGIFFTQDGSQYQPPRPANDIVSQRNSASWPAVMYFNPNQITPDIKSIVGQGILAAAAEDGAAPTWTNTWLIGMDASGHVTGDNTTAKFSTARNVSTAQMADYDAWLRALGLPTDQTTPWAHAMLDTIAYIPGSSTVTPRRPFAKFTHPLWALVYQAANPSATSIPSGNSALGWGVYLFLEPKNPWSGWSASNPYVLRLYVATEPTSLWDGIWNGLQTLAATIIQDVVAVVAAVGQVACGLVTAPGAGTAIGKTSGPAAGAGVTIAAAACGGPQLPPGPTADPTVTILLIGGAALAAILLVKAVKKKKAQAGKAVTP